MANVPMHFSARIIDGLGTEATTVAYLLAPDTNTIAGVITALDSWAGYLDAVTDGAITALSVKMTPALPGGLKGATGATWQASRVEQTAVLNFGNNTTTRKFGEVIPAFSNSLISSGKVNLLAGAITNFIGYLQGTPVTGGSFTNTASQALAALIDAILSFRKRRKQLSRTSFEV